MHLLVVLFLAIAIIFQQEIIVGGELLKTPNANDVPEIGMRSSWDATIEPAASSFEVGPRRCVRSLFPGYPGYPGFPGLIRPPPQILRCPGPMWPRPMPSPLPWSYPPKIIPPVNCKLCHALCPPQIPLPPYYPPLDHRPPVPDFFPPIHPPNYPLIIRSSPRPFPMVPFAASARASTSIDGGLASTSQGEGALQSANLF